MLMSVGHATAEAVLLPMSCAAPGGYVEVYGLFDVGSLSVYVLLLLVSKEAAFANGLTEYSQAGRDIERVGGVKEKPCSHSWRQRCQNLTNKL